MERRQSEGQRPFSRRLVKHLLGIGERGVGCWKQDESGRGGHAEREEIRCPRWAGQVVRQTDQWRVNPERLFGSRHEQDDQERTDVVTTSPNSRVRRAVRHSGRTRGGGNS